MGLTDENRKDIVIYRSERAFAALDFIIKVTDLAKEKLGL